MCLDRPCGAGILGGGVLPGGVLPGGVVGGGGGVWCPVRIFAAGHPSRGHTRFLSAVAVSRTNRSFRVKTTNAITLIISYLDFDFRMYFYIMG